jgi:glutaredoxin
MINVPQLYLLSTKGCHLCEVAVDMLNKHNCGYNYVDIIEQAELIEAYGDKIPVLLAEGAERALFWPFEIEQVIEYKKYYGIN